jgi:hypothetical protein
MKSPRRLAWLLLVLGIGLLVAFPFRAFLLDNLVMPVALVAWLLWRVVLSVNQAVYWGLAIVAVTALVVYRLAQAGAVAESISPPAPASILKSLADWRTWLLVTGAESQASDMLRRQLAQMLAAMYAAKSPQAASQFIYYDGLQQGRIPLPARVYAFLFPDEARAAERSRKGRLQRWAERPQAWIRHWTGRDRAEFYRTVEDTLAFMETFMEIKHGDDYFDPSDN